MNPQQRLTTAFHDYQAGRFDEAEQGYRQVLAQQPEHADALHMLGILAGKRGKLDESVNLIRQAIVASPANAFYYGSLGNALQDLRHFDEAIASFRQAIRLNPGLVGALNNLANLLRDTGQLEETLTVCRQAIALQPNYAEAHFHLGVALKDKGQFDEAAAALRRAINLQLNLAEAHSNLAMVLLAKEDFQQGWQEYEWRWKCKGFPFFPRNFSEPRWDGRPLESRPILIRTEQGIGDALQFIRYLPLVAQRGGRIIVETYPELLRLFQTMPGNYHIAAQGQPLPKFDFQCPLLSLPRIFGTTFASIPQNIPYLQADAEDAKKWRRQMAGLPSALNIGLVWAGNAVHKNDFNRSIKLATLSPLVQTPGVRFFSLQKGAAAAERGILSTKMNLVDWTDELKDFADTAALIANLDLVISVDTAVAHLAGAMGKPVWTLLPFVPDWRWLLERPDTPWYSSMRLFRQPTIGDWNSVITRLVEALSLWIKQK